MNSALRSLELSPSFQLLQESGSSMSNMIYTLDDSTVPLAKQKYELNLPSSTAFGSNVSLDLLRVGLLSGITLKLHLHKFAANSVGAVGGGYNAIKQISLCSHNKKIITLDKSSIQWRLSKLEEKLRDQVYSSSQYFGVVPNLVGMDDSVAAEYGKRIADTTTFSSTEDAVDNTSTVFLYIPFCIFEDGLRTMASFNMEYIENLTLNVEFDVASEMVDSGSSPSLKASQSKVIVHYFDMTNDDKRKFEEMNYQVKNDDGDGAINGNLSIVLKDYYVEPAVPNLLIKHNAGENTLATSSVAGRIGVFQQNLTCRNVITSIYVRVQNLDSQSGLEGVDSIESIELQLDGKSYVKYDREELMLRSSVNHGISVPDQGMAAGRNASKDNYLELKFDMNKSNAFSGAISARNTGSPKLIVRCLASNTSTPDNGYKLHVVCEHISMITIQEIDGRIQKSQNL